MRPIKHPFTLTPAGHILIDAQVNGVAGKFIVDTGAGMNMLTKKFAEKVPALTQTHHFYTGHRASGEQLDMDLWQAEQLSIGDYEVGSSLFSVADVDFPIAGLISLTALRENIFSIDFTTQSLEIDTTAPTDNGMTKLALTVLDDRDINLGIFTQVTLNNKLTLTTKLDSGAGQKVFRFNARYMKVLGFDVTEADAQQAQSDFVENHNNSFYSVPDVKVSVAENSISLKNNVTFVDGLIYEGIIDTNWLGRKLTFDISNKLLLVS